MKRIIVWEEPYDNSYSCMKGRLRKHYWFNILPMTIFSIRSLPIQELFPALLYQACFNSCRNSKMCLIFQWAATESLNSTQNHFEKNVLTHHCLKTHWKFPKSKNNPHPTPKLLILILDTWLSIYSWFLFSSVFS